MQREAPARQRFWVSFEGLGWGVALDGQPVVRCRWSLRRLCAVQLRSHSLSHAVKPRLDIIVRFWQVLSCPNTGSTVRERIL
jgi:hypothetical protein